MARTVIPITEWGMMKATLTTAETGTNNDLKFTANAAGPEGNSIQIEYVENGNNTPLSVEIVGQKIVVNLATDGSGNSTSTAQDVMTAIQGDAVANAMVSVENAGADDGTGLLTVDMAAANLSGGGFGPTQPSQTAGDVANGNYIENNGLVLLEVRNDDAAPQTVTFKAPAALVAAGKAADRTEPVVNGTTELWGPFPTDMNQNGLAGGQLWITASDADLKFRAYKVVQRT